MLQIEQLTKSYSNGASSIEGSDHFYAINEISFTLRKSELLGIVGLSGSGKTTLLRCILQLTKPDSGMVYYQGIEITSLTENQLREKIRPHLRKVYQHPETALNPGLTMGQIIGQAVDLYADETGATNRREKIVRLLQDVGLPVAYMDKYPHQLSGGEKRRVALARAIATDPNVLFADEPFAGLDKVLQYQMLKLLIHLKRHRDLTVVIVSHDIDVIRHVCDRIITLKAGRVVDIAEADEMGITVNMDHFE